MIGRITVKANFSDTSRYLTGGDVGRVEHVETRRTWTEIDEETTRGEMPAHVTAVTMEMSEHAEQLGSSRLERDAVHLSISWPHRNGENVDQVETAEQVEAMEALLRDLDLGEHQALLVVHRDAAHKHIHALVNRVGPEGKAWDDSMSYRRVEQSLRRQEKEKGWTRVKGRHAGRERYKGARALSEMEQKQIAAGKMTFADVARERTETAFLISGSWAELRARIGHEGFQIQPGRRGRGAVVTDGERTVNASSIGRDFSGPRLAKRFGTTLREHLAEDEARGGHLLRNAQAKHKRGGVYRATKAQDAIMKRIKAYHTALTDSSSMPEVRGASKALRKAVEDAPAREVQALKRLWSAERASGDGKALEYLTDAMKAIETRQERQRGRGGIGR